MIQNYLKILSRNLRRNKAYAFINILGLAVGIASCLLIFLVVRYELSYDKFQPAYSDIYRVVTQETGSEGIGYNPGIPYPSPEALRVDFPQITSGVLFATFGTQITIPGAKSQDGKKFIESNGVFFCDPQFFYVFSYHWLAGNPSVLRNPNMVALTRSLAIKYFGDWKNAIGHTLKIDNALDVKVAGIMEDLPLNTDFPITMVGSFITIKNNSHYGYTSDWGSTSSNFQVFMRVPKNIRADKLNPQLAKFSDKYYKNNVGNKRTCILQPLSDIHFNTQIGNFGDHITSRATLVTLSMIGFLIIIMACINFINLSTAQAVTRSREVGVRKVLGSNRFQLFFQVMAETKLVVLLSCCLAILMARLVLPYLKDILNIKENLSLFTAGSVLFIIAVITVVTLFSGLYPALVLSGFQPVMALKNKISSASIGGISLRRGLVVTQFAISQVLVVGTIVAVSQMNFIRTADLGFNKEAILILYSPGDSTVLAREKSFKENLLQITGVKMVSLCSDAPSSDNNSGINFAFDHKPGLDFTLYTKFGDADYFKTFGLELVAGEAYTAEDTAGQVVVNETLLKKLNVKTPQEAIGKEMKLGSNRWRRIAGVVKDFKTNSLREEIKPLLIASRKRQFGLISLKLHSNNLLNAQLAVQKAWESFFPEYAYNGAFLDENIEQFYRQEKQMTLLYKIFAGLAIFISCLGLYGLVSFMAVQRTKEVGIRKVLGAGVGSIMLLFSKEFTVLIVIAFVIAAPAAWYFMNSWLDNFAYRIHIGWQVFVIAVLISMVVAWLSVGYKAFRAAIANPVKSLRTE